MAQRPGRPGVSEATKKGWSYAWAASIHVGRSSRAANEWSCRRLRGAWIAACEAAGLPGRSPHDFRRTALRNLEQIGVSRSAAMAMVGHKTEAIYRRYVIVDAGALREAAAKIDAAELQRGRRARSRTTSA